MYGDDSLMDERGAGGVKVRWQQMSVERVTDVFSPKPRSVGVETQLIVGARVWGGGKASIVQEFCHSYRAEHMQRAVSLRLLSPDEP